MSGEKVCFALRGALPSSSTSLLISSMTFESDNIWSFTPERFDMATLKELIEQKEALEAQIAAARNAELSGAIAQIRALMAEYQLTPADILGVSAKTPKARKSTVAPKYRDPVSGATWSGRGRSPVWLQGRNKDEFLIG